MSEVLSTKTKDQQSRLASYCRTGVEPELEGTTAGRVSHYRRLVYSVVLDALTRSYPLAVNLLSDEEWTELCHDFFEEHACQEPQVWKMPFELIAYVETNKPTLTSRYPHLLTLLRFEWKEVEYYMMPDRDLPTTSSGDFWKDPWVLNPESEVLLLDYPVHIKNAKQIDASHQGQYHCLVYRNLENGKVHFMNLSPFFAWLINRMLEHSDAPESLSQEFEQTFGISDSNLISEQLLPFWKKITSDGMTL